MIPHKVLAARLKRHGFDGWIFRCVRNWLSDCIQTVTVNASMFNLKLVTSGVLRGSTLRPVLFSIFISGIGTGIECTLNKFADNSEMSGAVNSLEGGDLIQWDLDRLEEWAHVNVMKFNKAKGKVLYLGEDNSQYHDRLDDECVKSSPKEKDLGVLVNKKLNMNWQCALAAQASNILRCIRSIVASRGRKVILPVHSSLMWPHLKSCIQLWGPQQEKHMDLLDMVQKRAA